MAHRYSHHDTQPPSGTVPVVESTIPTGHSYRTLNSFLTSRLDGPVPPTLWSRLASRHRYGRALLAGAGVAGVFLVMFIVLGALGVFKNEQYRSTLGLSSVGQTKYAGDSWGTASPGHFDMGGKGDGTYYDPGVGITACGGSFTAQDMIVALNHVDYGDYANPNESPVCGACIVVTGPLGTAKATIQDECPVCGQGSLDLSPAVFGKVGTFFDGRIPVSWTAC